MECVEFAAKTFVTVNLKQMLHKVARYCSIEYACVMYHKHCSPLSPRRQSGLKLTLSENDTTL